jgi:hypothetical protein
MQEISMLENPTAFNEMIQPISVSVRTPTSLFPRDSASIMVDRPIEVAENAELLIGLLRKNLWC